jgi:CRISPR-associated protein Csx17
MSQHQTLLPGCTPEPLISYLKALGILRLVSEDREHGDPIARGAFRNDVFVLRSSLDADGLADFFLQHYKPTPILAPWGARSGFYGADSEKSAREALNAIMRAKGNRFDPFQRGVEAVRTLLTELQISTKAKDDEKLALLVHCRNELPEEFLPWLDACYVLTAEDRKFPPLLGTGGNEGSGSYVSGFAQQIVACLVQREHDTSLRHSLFGFAAEGITGGQMPGHFSPRNSGGANAGQGFEGPSTTNRWDYLFCLEGACLWAAGVVRKFGMLGRSVAAFPFTVNVSGAGSSSLSIKDSRKPKQAKREVAEMWLPLWQRFATVKEVSTMLAEGRATLGRRLAEYGVDFARSASSLGVDRGIEAFERTAFLMRNGQSFMGISMGRFPVKSRKRANLLGEIDRWLASYRMACGDKAPARFTSALHQIERAIFDYCRYGGSSFFQLVLIALGRAERELAGGESFRTDRKNGHVRVRPLNGLSAEWISAASDPTTECEIALALAGVYDQHGKIGPLRANLEPFDWEKRTWSKATHSVVWQSSDLATNLSAVLRRRVLDASREQCAHLPLAFKTPASLDAIAQFLSRETNDERIEFLLWGFLPVQLPEQPESRQQRENCPPLSRLYSVLKLCFLPFPLEVDGEQHLLKPEPAILSLLNAGRVSEACDIALRRLRAIGLRPLGDSRAGSSYRVTGDALIDENPVDGHRMAAALLIPISQAGVGDLCRQALRLPSKNQLEKQI